MATIPDSNWSKDRLMGKSVSFKGAINQDGTTTVTSPAGSKQRHDHKEKIDPMLWGRPGHLSEEEADIYMKFKDEVESRGGDFKKTVYCFGEEEGEVWALCRWLRARKFVYQDVITMVEEATQCRADAKAADFYPDPKAALGCDMSVYFAQYPQLYSGFAKNGSPLFISKPGVLNVDAIECITTLTGIVKFHWYIMMHDFACRLRSHKEKDPHFKKFECVCVLDLAHLTMSQLSQRALAIVKEQSAIDSLCFPETMNKMYIINGPRFFGATWSLIKGWLDPRTANKIEVISNRKTWEKALLEYVDEDQLPSDYGGKGPDTQQTIEKEYYSGKLKRMHTEVIYLRGSNSTKYDIGAGEELQVSVYTRSVSGAKFTLVEASSKHAAPWVSDVVLTHTGTGDTEEPPSHKTLNDTPIKGPASVKVKIDAIGSRWSTQNMLVVFSVLNP